MNESIESTDDLKVVAPSAIESIERANIDMQIATAHRYPRTLSKVKADMLSFATLDEETAASCFYTLPRGGKTIQGPSVRLAEIAIACYGNIRAGSRVVSVDTGKDNPHVVVQSVAHDLEKNVAITIEKRRRITKKKSKDSIDEDDINLASNAGSSIALRDAIFKVVPLALIKPVYEAAKLVAIGQATSLSDKRGKVIDRLKQMGALLPNILAVVSARTIEDVDADRLGILIGLGTALKDGETTIEEAFPSALAKTESISAVLGDKKDEKKAKEPEKQDASKAPVAEKKAEPSATPAPVAAPAPVEQGVAYTEAELKKLIGDVENYGLNLGLSAVKIVNIAFNNGWQISGKAKEVKDIPFATLQKILAHLQTHANKPT